SEALKVRGTVYVEAAQLQGGSRWHVLLTHVLPNASRSVLSLAVLQFGVSILVIAGLAFLGYGDPPPASD
ncbi:ABC transporter permease subunit, partial [Vibrio parahaemolyticus]